MITAEPALNPEGDNGLIAATELPKPRDELAHHVRERLFSVYPSPTLLLIGGVFFLSSGAMLLRLDLVLLGLIPFAIIGYAFLSERRLVSGMRARPLRGVAWPPPEHARVGTPVTIPVELENGLPFSMGILRMEIRTCPGFSSEGRIVRRMGANSRIHFDVELLPTRPGPAFFYGLSVIITSPLGFRPRRYYLLLPISLMVSPALPTSARNRRRDDLKLFDRRPVPTFDGDFAYLREYLPGDPFKAVVKAASIKKRKPIVRLSYPMKKEKWCLFVDLSPALFRGLPGFSPFDSIAGVLPFIIRKLKKFEHEVSLLLYRETVLEFLPTVLPSEIVTRLARYRYMGSEDLVRLPDQLLHRLSLHLAWNFGVSLRFPDSLEGENRSIVARQLRELRDHLPLPKGIAREETGDQHDELIAALLELAYLTGLELPATNEEPPSLEEAMDVAIARGIQNVIVFSEHEPYTGSATLSPRLLFAARRGISVRFMLLDTHIELLRPFGKELLERQARYRWDTLLPDIRRAKARATFWHPSFPRTLNAIFHTDSELTPR